MTQLEIIKLQEQKRKIILLFKQYKLYTEFRTIINLMATIADYTWHMDDVPSLLHSLEKPSITKTHIGQLNQQEIESLLEWITTTYKQIKTLLQDKKILTQNQIVDKYYNSNLIDKHGNIIASPMLRTIAEIPHRIYLMQTYKQLENTTYNT